MRNVLIDLDGVTYCLSKLGAPSIFEAAERALQKFDMPTQKLLEARENGLLDEEMYKPYWDVVDCDDYKTAVFNQIIVRNTDYSKIPANPELFEIIKNLQKKYDITVVTDNTIFHVEEVFRALWSKGIVLSDIDVYSIEDAKTGRYCITKSEGGLSLFCERRNLEPSDCLLIDDNHENIMAANRLGMQTILFDGSQDINELLKKL